LVGALNSVPPTRGSSEKIFQMKLLCREGRELTWIRLICVY